MTKESGDRPKSVGQSVTEVSMAQSPGVGSVLAVNERLGRYRWVICALLFFATTINYVDRQVIGILAKDLQLIIGWNEIEYGNIVAAFSAAYAFGLLVAGRLMDRFGTKIGYAIAIVIWSLAGIVTAFARTPFQFGMVRAALGLGEAGNFPAAIKTVAEWFPKKERAMATGIFNAGTNVGAVVAPLTVPWIARNMGWEWAFILTGAIGFLWLAFWLPVYRKPELHPKVSRAELAYIQSDPADPVVRTPWIQLIPRRQAAAFAIAKYLTDPIWWFYLFWTPNFLRDKHHLNLDTIPAPLIAIYLIADVGSVGGGWLSSNLIKRGWSVNKARKTAMLICALAVTPVVFVGHIDDLWLAVSLIGLAAAAHQGWSANVFTTVSDTFPRQAVGSVVGIGGMAGAVGGVTLAVVTGALLQKTPGDYTLNFVIAGSIYLVTLGVIHLMVPRLQPVEVGEPIEPVSVGSIVGFGFVGLVFGTFLAWVLGLILAAGPALLTYLGIGAATGAVAGAIAGIAICSSLRSR
jgi:ACS family hexuronate transporter-like MFS transporter